MAINRKDTPLANTPDPTIDPTVKKTTTVNPNGTKTYKMSWVTNKSTDTPARKSTGTISKSTGTKNVAKSSGTSSSKSNYNEREFSTLPEVKTKGVIEKKAEIKPLDASNLTKRGDNRTWQEKRKQEMLKKDYNKYKKGDETYDEFRDRAKKSSEEITRKAKPTGKGFLSGRGGSGGGGSCGC